MEVQKPTTGDILVPTARLALLENHVADSNVVTGLDAVVVPAIAEDVLDLGRSDGTVADGSIAHVESIALALVGLADAELHILVVLEEA